MGGTGPERSRGLTQRTLTALADLETRTINVDSGRLKLEWGALRARSGHDMDDLLWWADGRDRLIGFLGLYSFTPETVELAGMVDPEHRRRGIGSALLDVALALCAERNHRTVLLVTPRASVGGRVLALGRGGTLDHSEHALELTGPSTDGPTDSRMTLRPAEAHELPAVAVIVADAFGGSAEDALRRLRTDPEGRGTTMAVHDAGVVVGTVRLTLDGSLGGVYGFAVDHAHRGRGIGRDVLRRACRRLRDGGANRIGLEVAVENEHALGLYTSLGFTPVTTEDYYRLPPATT